MDGNSDARYRGGQKEQPGWTDNNEVHGVEVDGPFVREDRFAVRFAIDTTFRPTGERTTITKMSLYTVEDGKVVREEVYYNAPPLRSAG